jgi:hypothetical protein
MRLQGMTTSQIGHELNTSFGNLNFLQVVFTHLNRFLNRSACSEPVSRSIQWRIKSRDRAEALFLDSRHIRKVTWPGSGCIRIRAEIQ